MFFVSLQKDYTAKAYKYFESVLSFASCGKALEVSHDGTLDSIDFALLFLYKWFQVKLSCHFSTEPIL